MPDERNPQAWNRYAYVLNNPLGYVDPTGHVGQCSDEGGTCGYREQTIPELDPSEWEHFQSYDLGVTYEQFLQAREYYYAYANSPDLYYADLEVINGFQDGSDAHSQRRRSLAKLYAEYVLNQPLNSVANVDFAMDALARMPDHLEDSDYFFFGTILFGGAVGGMVIGDSNESSIPPYDRKAYGNWKRGGAQ